MSDAQKWQLLALVVLIGALLYWLGPVLTPFVFAAMLAYLGDPLVDRLERRGLTRTPAVLVVFLAMFLAMVVVLLLLIPMLERQLSSFIERLPSYIAWFRTSARPWLEARTGLELASFDTERIVELLQQHWREAGGFAAMVVGALSKSGFTVLAWIVNFMMIPVVTFYLLRDWDVMVDRINRLLPRAVEPTVSQLARESDVVLGGFLRGQLSVMVALGLIYTLGLWAIGIDLALLIGMTAGLISFVPYLGTIVGLVAALIAAVVQYQDVMHVLLVLGVFGVGQLLEGFVLTPWLVGDKIGLHPVAVIFAVLAGGQLFGFLGILLALPVASIVMVLLRHAHQRYLESGLYGAPAAEPVAVAQVAEPAADSSAMAAPGTPPAP